MKIKNLIAASLILFSVSSSFATYVRTTSNGGPSGYDKTSKVVDGAGNTTIDCSNPGYAACPEMAHNPKDNTLVDAAIARIQGGELSGSITTSDGTVTWSSDNSSMTNSRIAVTN